MSDTSRMLGDIRIDRVLESEEPEFPLFTFFPDATVEALAPHRSWMEPRFLEPGTDKIIAAVQSYVVRTKHHTILIDTCVGNHKPRRFWPAWNMRESERYLKGLADIGVSVEQIDFVMCTHLHTDHVGWNTRLINGQWVPTFPNARYVFAKDEFTFWEELNKKGAKYSDGCINDSVLPVVDAGQADLVSSDFSLDDNLWIEPTPGHTPGHISIRLSSCGCDGVLTGDVMHSPIQCTFPDWGVAGDGDKDLARQTRKKFLDRYAETDTRILTSHFPSPSAGFIRRAGETFKFVFEGET